MTIQRALSLLILMLLPPLSAAESAEGILPQSLVTSLRVNQLFEYRCPRNAQCSMTCSGQEEFAYKNVKLAELARSKTHWVFGIVHVDSLGKGHKAIGFIPEPAACVLDDLEFSAQIPIVEGAIDRTPDEVIFDLTPSN